MPASFHPIIIELEAGGRKKIEQKVRGRMYAYIRACACAYVRKNKIQSAVRGLTDELEVV